MIRFALITAILALFAADSLAAPRSWEREWPDTDFSQTAVPLDEIISGGPPKDGIPSIDDPSFEPIEDAGWLSDISPVISLSIDGEARAYPLSILNRHEIVNDRLGGVPVAVTFCPLCNAAIAFDRRAGDRVLEFGTTGKLRHSDLVMYDRQTESWWQQFTGTAIVGEMTGTKLGRLPARIESFSQFAERHPDGRVLKRPSSLPGVYGKNPYVGYDSQSRPHFYRGPMPEDVAPMARVVTVGGRAWALDLVREKGRIESGDLVIAWRPGQASALDRREVAKSRDIGTVTVQRRTGDGLMDVPYGVDFAFAFKAFHPEGDIVTAEDLSGAASDGGR